MALALWATGVLELDQALAGFGDPTVLFIASLFVVSEALDATGVTAWAGQKLIDNAGANRRALLVLTMLLVARADRADQRQRRGRRAPPGRRGDRGAGSSASPSGLLMPLAFAAHAGSLLLLTGSPVNVIVSEAPTNAGAGRFGFFEFALVGIPLLAGTIVIVMLLRRPADPRAACRRPCRVDFSEHARTLASQYDLEQDPDDLLTRRAGVAEIVIPPRSTLIGETVFPGMVTAERRPRGRGRPPPRTSTSRARTVLVVGDTLLLEGDWDALEAQPTTPTYSRSTRPTQLRRQAVPLGPGANARSRSSRRWSRCSRPAPCRRPSPGCWRPARSSSPGVLTLEQAYRGDRLDDRVLVAGMIPLSTAMTRPARPTFADELVDSRQTRAASAAARARSC